MTVQLKRYESAAEVEAVVRKFEACLFGPDEFHHREHLTVALCYLLESNERTALERLRDNLFRFIRHHHIEANVYHETITLFWLKRVGRFLERSDKGRALAELANELIAECCDARLVKAYFSQPLLDSAEAREGWVEPDVQPLDF
ncbi:MAG: hypothetical protein JO360_09955 [Acidobacteria bacterium]|nr:hypothetical protein [Acidobacteriota bacterium]